MKRLFPAALLCAALLAGCTAPASPAPTATPTVTAAPTPTASPAPTTNPDNTPERFWELAAHDQYLAGVITDCRFTDYPGECWIAFTADDGQAYRVEGALGKEHEGLPPFHSLYSYSGKASDECRPGWQVLVYYEDELSPGDTTITRPKDIFLFSPEDTAGPEEQLFTTEYELDVLRKNFDGIEGKTVFTPDEAMRRVAEHLGLQVEAQSPSPGVTQYTDGNHTLDFHHLWYNRYYQLDREQAARANADLSGWVAKLDDPDFPGEQALTTPYVEYEILDLQSDGQSTSYYVSITGDVSTTPATVTIPASGEETDTLSFLTEEQKDLYQKALELSTPLFGMPENLNGVGPFRPLGDGNGNWARNGDYYLYENSYAEWEDWMYSIFTPAYIQQLGRLYTDKFVDLDGHLATYFDNSLLRTWLPGHNRMVTENVFPLYRLESLTEDELTFTLLAPYDTNYRNSNTPQDMTLEWREYPIRMVNTDDGWRIDEFHTAEYG